MTRQGFIRGTSVLVMLVGLFAFPDATQAQGEGCTSGGPGSNSCSITFSDGAGCSVSCTAGYYACCSGSGCSCVETQGT